MIDFNNVINNYLKREVRQKTIGNYYPSESGSCLRKVWYSYKIPREVSDDLKRIFHAGNLMHSFVTDLLKSEKTPEVELISEEVPFKIRLDEFSVSGRIDNLFLVKINNQKVLLEVKSCSFLSSFNKPNPIHISQIQLYMHATGMEESVLLYLEKNTLKAKSFTIKYDSDLTKEILKRFKNLDLKLKENKLPEPEAKLIKEQNWQCRNCSYKDLCDKNLTQE